MVSATYLTALSLVKYCVRGFSSSALRLITIHLLFGRGNVKYKWNICKLFFYPFFSLSWYLKYPSPKLFISWSAFKETTWCPLIIFSIINISTFTKSPLQSLLFRTAEHCFYIINIASKVSVAWNMMIFKFSCYEVKSLISLYCDAFFILAFFLIFLFTWNVAIKCGFIFLPFFQFCSCDKVDNFRK